jgi:hypothetical protein
MPEPLELLNEELRMTAVILIQRLENAGRADALPADEFPLFEILEEIDDATCDLCLTLDGMIISRDHPDFDDLQQPSHINCRRVIVGVGADEVGPDEEPIEPDYERPSSELIDKHGHFMVDKERYAPLRVPAQPEGRDFIARAYVDEEGKRRVKLDWRIPEYELQT